MGFRHVGNTIQSFITKQQQVDALRRAPCVYMYAQQLISAVHRCTEHSSASECASGSKLCAPLTILQHRSANDSHVFDSVVFLVWQHGGVVVGLSWLRIRLVRTINRVLS